MSSDLGGYSAALTDVGLAPSSLPQRLASFLSSRASIGALCESSRWLSRRMAREAELSGLPIVELGAGFGSVTRFLPESTVSIEREEKRFLYLKQNFPERTILSDCAVAFLADIREPTVILSSIPNVNNPQFAKLKASVARASKAGTVKHLVTYTYFPVDPFAGIFAKSERIGLELLNLPPAFLWSYTC